MALSGASSRPSVSNSVAAPSPSSSWIRLNVGGKIFQTTRATLLSDPHSMLAAMFGSDCWNQDNLPRDDTGAFLIDADPKYFAPILNFLRRGELSVNDGISLNGVLAEARYFNIQALVDLLEVTLKPGKFDLDAKLTWEDIGGLNGVKKELQQVVEHSVKYRSRFETLGVAPSKNLLLYGPPGCGKTLLARVTANEIKANFLLVKCPELLSDRSMAAQQIQDKFKTAKAMQPCVIFLEEFECIARVRGNGDAVGDALISQLAISLDSVSTERDSIFVIAATNRPDILEPALLRPGRFDQLIYIPLPDRNARLGILKVALRKAALSEDVDLCYLADHTHGLSGADLKEICQRACKFAIRESIEKGLEEMVVNRSHFEMAMSYSRRSVGDTDLYRFEHFNRLLQQIAAKSFSFPPVGQPSS